MPGTTDVNLLGYAARLTHAASLRLALLVDPEPGAAWVHLFETTNPPVTDELFDLYVDHGVEAEERVGVFIDLKPGSSEDVMLYALDWLKATVGEVNRQHRTLRAEADRAARTAEVWFNSNGQGR